MSSCVNPLVRIWRALLRSSPHWPDTESSCPGCGLLRSFAVFVHPVKVHPPRDAVGVWLGTITALVSLLQGKHDTVERARLPFLGTGISWLASAVTVIIIDEQFQQYARCRKYTR